ncbi:MAG: hypothetical protein KDD61_12530, partial [Bdellovibrionales bacterium]|nr:hypothetical protein [Bdellovibrionales bacterium]
QLIYDGYDHATFLSGLADGSYFFRVRSKASSIEPQAWSKPTKLDVRHHTLRSAFLLFSIGLVSFVLVIIAILKGHGKSKFGAPQT